MYITVMSQMGGILSHNSGTEKR